MESSRRTLLSFLLALLVHGLLLGVLVLGFGWTPQSEPTNPNSVPIVQATVVERDKVMGQQQRAVRELQKEVTPQKVEQQSLEAQRRQQEIAEQTQREVKKQRELKQKRQQEQARLQQLETERKAKEEARRKTEAEKRQRQAEEEEKQRAEAKKRRLEEEKRQAEKAKREAEEKQKKAEAARRRAEEERRQQALQASIEAEQNAVQAEAAIKRFIPQLQMRVQRYWIRPPSTHDNMVVLLQVELLPSGEVRDVKIVESSGDRTFDRSAQAAVYRAAPLPVPTNPAAAAKLRSFNFKFCPGSSC
jgi:colicin import membrane protein